jgi:nucleotide-binding universal stress UspA family protein
MRPIVVGVDSSAAAGRALDRAVFQGQRSGRPVHVVHAWQAPVWVGGALGYVYDYDVFASGIGSEADARTLADDLVAKARPRQVSDLPVEITVDVLEGPAGQVLVDASRDAALLVVGGRGHGPLTSALLGSATAHALHHAECPVMVVPEHGSPVAPYGKVVVGTDGSEPARAAMRWGHRAAKEQGAPLLVVHAWLLATIPAGPAMFVGPEVVTFEHASREWLQQEVKEVLGDDPGDVRTELTQGTASQVLLDAAGPDDLLVLGSRGRGGFTGLHLGSVSSQCARHGHGVVVVLRAGQERLDD